MADTEQKKKPETEQKEDKKDAKNDKAKEQEMVIIGL